MLKKNRNIKHKFVFLVTIANFINIFMKQNGSVSNLSDYYSVFIHEFIRLLADKQEKIQRSSWQALNQVVKSMESSEMMQFIGSVQNAFNTVKNEKETLKNEGHVPGLCLPKLVSLYSIFFDSFISEYYYLSLMFLSKDKTGLSSFNYFLIG